MNRTTSRIDDIKREFDKKRLVALAEREGLASSPGRIQCPLRCSDDKRGASVSEAGLWHCKHCDRGGSAIDLVMATRSVDLESAVELLTVQLGSLPEPAKQHAPPDVAALWRKLASSDAAGEDYLRERGLHAAVAQGAVRFNIGGTGHTWLDRKSAEGYRVAMALHALTGEIASLQLRSITPQADPRMSKISLAGVTYPQGGVAFGQIGQARQAARVFVSEGMADTLALLIGGAVVVGAPGVDQVKRLPHFLGDVTGRTVILCPQNDVERVKQGKNVRLTSESAFRELEHQLSAAGADVVTLRTPAPHKDPAEWLKAVGVAAFKDHLAAAQPEFDTDVSVQHAGATALKLLQLPARDSRPRIVIRVEEHLVAEEAVAALTSDTTVFQRDGQLVHVVRDQSPKPDERGMQRPPATPRIVPLPVAMLRERMAAAARWMKPRKSKGDMVKDHPPEWVTRAVHARGSWSGIRWLTGVVESPVLRRDGSILDEPGYDLSTGLLYEPAGEVLEVPEQPTREDAQRAWLVLQDAIQDFPFATEAHYAAWLAALLTPLARHAFEGPAPLFLFDANTRGSGKTKLVDLIAVVVTGREIPRTPNDPKEEEWRKRITSIALAGDPLVLIDNIAGALGSAALDAALTGTAVSDRGLGGNSIVNARLNAVWYASGNNVQLKGDLFRRTLHVRLESPDEKPEERTGFAHPELLDWARAERPRLLQAALTILRAYFVAGRPRQDIKPWGSFESWSALVRGAIVWLGLADPFLTREGLAQASDPDTSMLAQLLSAWEEHLGGKGATLRQIVNDFNREERVARQQKVVPEHPRLFDVLADLAPTTNDELSAVKLGYVFRRFRGRVIGGKSLESKVDRDGIAVWRLTGVSAGDAGDCGGSGSGTPGAIDQKNQQTLPLISRHDPPQSPASPADSGDSDKNVEGQ